MRLAPDPPVLIRIKPGRELSEPGPLGVEHLLSTLHPLHLPGLTLVIESNNGLVEFGIKAPAFSAAVIESFVYAQYPNASCEVISDIDRTANDSATEQAVFLRLRRPGVFPVKRHPQLIDVATKEPFDPLGLVLTSLSANPRLRTSIEIQLEPVGGAYRERATKALLAISAREFPRAEKWTDRYVRLRLHSRPLRVLLHPLASFCRRRIPFPSEAPIRAVATEAAQTHDRESDVQACLAKVRRHLFVATIKLSVDGSPEDHQTLLDSLAASFAQFDLPGLNGFQPSRRPQPCVLSTEELATIWHLPSTRTDNPHLSPIGSTVLPPPRELTDKTMIEVIDVLGETLYRNGRLRIGLGIEERRRHLWIVGKTGTGKSTLLENLLLADIEQGRGLGLLDPHGDLASTVLAKIPSRRTNDVIVINPSDEAFPISFNPLDAPRSTAAFAADGVISTLMKLFASGDFGSWGPRLEDILRNTLLALIEAGGTTLVDLLRMFDDDDAFRRRITARIRDPLVRHWWTDEFPRLKANRREDPFASVTNKIRQLLTVPAIRNILAQRRSKLDLRQAMDSRKIVLCNLSKGKLGERTSMFLGSLLMTRFQLDAMSRADQAEHRRPDFFLYVDEFQNFATPSFAEVLSEARKYRLNLTLANQYLGQMPEGLVRAILGNVGTVISFAVGADDAPLLAEQLGGKVLPQDLLSLPRYQCYVRTEAGGKASAPFSLQTLPAPSLRPDRKRAAIIRQLSRIRYASPRDRVEAGIRRTF